MLKAGEQEETGDDSDDSSGGTPVRGRGGAGGRTIRSKSIGIQFKESLADLMATISTTQPRYHTILYLIVSCRNISYRAVTYHIVP